MPNRRFNPVATAGMSKRHANPSSSSEKMWFSGIFVVDSKIDWKIQGNFALKRKKLPCAPKRQLNC
ncbi:MAG: hypothetical protein VX705_00870 [Verrucomicrobiota bacterium]|nr:hypothetical protein [Verrucomicrobiota bacterium]